MVWSNNCLKLLDQTLLPGQVEYIYCHSWERIAEAIKKLEVRGAPAIGAAAAFAMVFGAREAAAANSWNAFKTALLSVSKQLAQTRPTAVNLFWALKRMEEVVERFDENSSPGEVLTALEQEAIAIAEEDKAVNQKISKYGASLFTAPQAVLTHCNAGALATVALGTALGVIREAKAQGNITKVFVDETRPLLQGARLTAWELHQDGIPVTLITDNTAGWVMKNKMVQSVIVGADRIARNGDVANKIGTYSVAVLAREHGIPFYVAAPVSTFDFSIKTGNDIPIEERCANEVKSFGGCCIAPEGISVFNPAFDVTLNSLVTAIITEHGVLRAPYEQAIEKLYQISKKSK
ncbi:MAG TPA: S-methyl-5-thioribose-1-phosphate isomerase [Methylomusa anaerophila]|uniref:Methylthioribose-1-phosphate isomerase n=1 Tax=Methylomusa anaerophila TaxID=1930071 RepID=A0A348APR8_9FIRM|nr:S-methyl-5-thioribose-1-phosphate isomerase [Methylomusa anaerophila]BBB93066.1 methylthioribose-1-phosphate isomerase [Methylomusa anaerophila]HML87101.1 S-methyl-5-thioribose-1-phosphate isomerase [Methylomusa anaerophila]